MSGSASPASVRARRARGRCAATILTGIAMLASPSWSAGQRIVRGPAASESGTPMVLASQGSSLQATIQASQVAPSQVVIPVGTSTVLDLNQAITRVEVATPEIADVTVFTTHKTLDGPRGAVILTSDEDKANLIDMAVFPGAQGGPHVNKFAALCVAFKLARTELFRQLQHRTVENAKALSNAFQARGLKVAYGGTDTHIVMLNVSAVKSETGFPLRGEMPSPSQPSGTNFVSNRRAINAFTIS